MNLKQFIVSNKSIIRNYKNLNNSRVTKNIVYLWILWYYIKLGFLWYFINGPLKGKGEMITIIILPKYNVYMQYSCYKDWLYIQSYSSYYFLYSHFPKMKIHIRNENTRNIFCEIFCFPANFLFHNSPSRLISFSFLRIIEKFIMPKLCYWFEGNILLCPFPFSILFLVNRVM